MRATPAGSRGKQSRGGAQAQRPAGRRQRRGNHAAIACRPAGSSPARRASFLKLFLLIPSIAGLPRLARRRLSVLLPAERRLPALPLPAGVKPGVVGRVMAAAGCCRGQRRLLSCCGAAVSAARWGVWGA